MQRLFAVAVGLCLISVTSSGCASSKKTAADFCSVVARTATAQDDVSELLNSGTAPTPDDLRAALDAFRSVLAEMSSAAPDAIADDMVFVVNGFTAFDLGMRQVDYDLDKLISDSEAAAAAAADLAALDAPETQAALDAVDQYVQAECGIQLSTNDG